MIRFLLTVALPVAVPFLLYGLYLLIARRRARLAGEGPLPGWQDAPWHVLLLVAVVLAFATLITIRTIGSAPPGAQLEPPSYVDGKIRPGQVRDGK